jgi:hypothetical protein
MFLKCWQWTYLRQDGECEDTEAETDIRLVEREKWSWIKSNDFKRENGKFSDI